ncbi:M23 family metallopeptidase [Rhizorhabdus sp.]|jgi:murein DD-endopeptidase MepM/ murein hydrolase activator NlpD|uniref:M23 family metallopeptidase n=1 Tax=Rhizorhabdus sp. TaxID=1968843 RepID=UPI001B5ED071|nr:M23 family metallopeptidase [Rhizorhabdus sp.]MBP8232643.1 M23 family metallopeptidase [Rhizorhabdus sp.]
MVRKLAIVLAMLVLGYVGWVVMLNLPGRSGPPETARSAKQPATVAVRQTSPSPAPQRSSTGLLIPVEGVTAAQLADTFDDARGEGRVHDAIDIMAPRGTPVIAAAAGTVEKLFDSKLGGRTIYVRRTGGQWIDYYAHLDSYAPGLAEGQRVEQGQRIATVGSTGDASADAPHLHFAVNAMAPGEGWWQGKAINPYPLLAGRN